jgi:Polysaccharide pyruvyl transferase
VKKYTFIFNIVTAFNNRGDLLINRALITKLRDIGHIAVVTKGIPEPFLSKLGLSEQEMYNSFWQCFKKNFGKRILVKVGIPGHNFGKPSANIQSYLQLILTALFKLILRVDFVRVGTSVGHLEKSAIQVERLKAKFYKIYGVRDNFSYNMFAPSKISYFPDLAFLSNDLKLNSEKAKALPKEPYIFLSFRPSFCKYPI